MQLLSFPIKGIEINNYSVLKSVPTIQPTALENYKADWGNKFETRMVSDLTVTHHVVMATPKTMEIYYAAKSINEKAKAAQKELRTLEEEVHYNYYNSREFEANSSAQQIDRKNKVMGRIREINSLIVAAEKYRLALRSHCMKLAKSSKGNALIKL